MATEDIHLTWKLLRAGWETVYEPHALVGMQVPSTLRALWAQRARWARGQGEVMHVHLREVIRWRNRRLWLVGLESVASLVWVVALAASLVITVLGGRRGGDDPLVLVFAWGIAIATVATLQLLAAIALEQEHDRTIVRTFLLAALYPVAYWMLAATAALRHQTLALLHGDDCTAPDGRRDADLARVNAAGGRSTARAGSAA